MTQRKKNNLTLKRVNKLFIYKEGKLLWNTNIKSSSYTIGDVVGSRNRFIPVVEIKNIKYQLHRIVYLLHHGACPQKIGFIDKTLTSEGSYNISIKNLYVPSKKAKTKKNKVKYKPEISFLEANTYLEYKAGRLYWKEKTAIFARMVVGEVAGSISKDSPYPKVMIHQKGYAQHRIVFLLNHGYCPEVVAIIDKTLTDEGVYDISVGNLKEMTSSLSNNTTNTRIGKTSKYRGVCYSKEEKKYRVRVSVDGIRKQYGMYINEVDAAKKYDEVAKKFIGEEARLNFP
ncbi:MAG: hypothetical protein COA79_23300 [Planctomycetota bacterium]|nr:MAG: hypothetical protein COA79_23300 [Planctomycetota bacterium]